MAAKKPTFAVRLKQLLAEADITAYRLAQLAGLPKQTVNRYMSGRMPTLENALRIARALDKSLSVFDDVDIPAPRKE